MLKIFKENGKLFNQIHSPGIYPRFPSVLDKNKSEHKSNHGLLQQALSDAKSFVDEMPLSFVRKSLKAVINNEFQAVTTHLAKIVTSGHPIVKTTQQILQSKHAAETRKIVVLLISKLIADSNGQLDSTKLNETFVKQSSLAELTELIYIAFLIQRGLVDFHLTNIPQNLIKEFEIGNKIAVLGGDFLLAKATVMLSQLENSKVLGLMASAVRDMSNGFFALPEQREHFDSNSKQSIPCSIEEWKHRNLLVHGSLLSNACKSGAILHDKEQEYGDICAQFGHHLILAQEARSDIERISQIQSLKDVDISNTQFFSELCSLPSAVAAESNGGKKWLNNFLLQNKTHTYSLQRDQFTELILKDESVLHRSEDVCLYHVNAAVETLHLLPDVKSRRCLEQLTLSLT